MTLTRQDPKIPQNVEDGKMNEGVIGALELIEKNYQTKTENDSRVQMKRYLYDEAFKGRMNTYPKFLTQKLPYQAVWQTLSRMKVLDFQIQGTGRKEWQEALVTAGVQTVLDWGGFYELWRGKNGIAFGMCVDGDAFVWIQKNPKKGKPILFNVISCTNVYVDSGALGFRGLGAGREATKAVVIFSYSWGQFCKLYPDVADKVTIGKIPRDFFSKETGRVQIKEVDRQEDLIEVAHAYDIDNDVYTSFAGASCTVIEQLEGDAYPHKHKGESFIPVVQFFGIPSGDGFWNYSLMDLLWDISDSGTKLKNMEMGHVWENTWPLVNLSLPQGEAAKYIEKMTTAYEMRANGYNGIIVNEYDPQNPYDVKADSLTTDNMGQDWAVVQQTLDTETQRSGIVLDSGDLGADPTRFQLMAEEDKKTAFVKKMLEDNASNFQAIVEYTMDAIQSMSRNDQTPLNLRVEVIETEDDQAETAMDAMMEAGAPEAEAMQTTDEMLQGGMFKPKKMPKREVNNKTLGWVAGELKDYNYFVDIDARSGAYTTELVKLAKLEGIVAEPGTKAYAKVSSERAKLQGLDIDEDDFNPEAPEQEMPEAPVGQAM